MAAVSPFERTTLAERGGDDALVRRILEFARESIGMEVAWVSRFTDSEQVLDVVSAAPGSSMPVDEGAATPLDGSYCIRVTQGALPSFIPDALADPVASLLAVTIELGIGAYVGAPLTDADGQVVGMLCAVSSDAKPELDAADRRFLELLAAAVSEVFADQAA